MTRVFFPFRVKPAAFDLFLGGCIAAYLGIVYYAIQVCCSHPFKLCSSIASLQTAQHLVCFPLKHWLIYFFPLIICLFSLTEFWLFLHKAQSGGEIQTPVKEDWVYVKGFQVYIEYALLHSLCRTWEQCHRNPFRLITHKFKSVHLI